MVSLLHRATIKKKKKPQGKNIMSASATQGGHNKANEANFAPGRPTLFAAMVGLYDHGVKQCGTLTAGEVHVIR